MRQTVAVIAITSLFAFGPTPTTTSAQENKIVSVDQAIDALVAASSADDRNTACSLLNRIAAQSTETDSALDDRAERARPDNPGVAACLTMATAMRAYRSGDLDAMDRRLDASSSYAEQADFLFLEPVILNYRANGFTMREDYDAAIAAYYEAIDLYKAQGQMVRAASALGNIGTIFDDIGDQEQAIAMYLESLEMLSDLPQASPIGIGFLKANIGEANAGLNRHEEALRWYGEARNAVPEGALPAMFESFLAFHEAESQLALGDRDDAIENAERAVELLSRDANPDGAGVAISWLAARRAEDGQTDAAMTLVSDARAIMEPEGGALRTSDQDMRYNYAANMYDAFSGLGRYAEAVDYQSIMMEIAESRAAAQNRRALAEAETRFALRDRQRALALTESDLKLARQTALVTDLRLRQSRSLLLGGAITAGLITLLTVLLFLLFRQQKALAEGRELMLREIHHRTKNNFQVLTSLFRLNPPQQHAATNPLGFSAKVRAMAELNDMMFAYSPADLLALRDLVDGVIEPLRDTFGRDDVSIETDIDPVNIVGEKATPLSLLIVELVTNAYKYAFPNQGGVITIAAKGGGESFDLTISDTGRGFPENPQPGVGLTIASDLARQIDSQLERQPAQAGTAWAVRAIRCD